MPLNGPHDSHDDWLDYLPHVSIGIYPMPWSWYWYLKPWLHLQPGSFGLAWLFSDLQVNWLPRRFWGRRNGRPGEGSAGAGTPTG